MKYLLCALCLLFVACDKNRVYQQYVDFETRYWLVDVKPDFEFQIDDIREHYNVYFNVRNSTHYPFARLFVMYYLEDSAGVVVESKLINQFLFEAKSGKPFGKTGLGDLFDHEFLLLKDYRFQQPGKYKIKFEQFMRTDSLQGILAVGLRVESAEPK